MIGRIRFLLGETGQNIWRNLALTLASVLVAMVSLTLFGASRLVAEGVDQRNPALGGRYRVRRLYESRR